MSEDTIRIGKPFAQAPADLAGTGIDAGTAFVPAPRELRLAAALLDIAFQGVLSVAALWLLGPLGLLFSAFAFGVVVLDLFFFFAPVLVLHGATLWTRGQTLGKRIVGIRIVRTNGDRVSFLRIILLRYLIVGIVVGVSAWVADRPGVHSGGIALRWIGWLVDALLIFGATQRCLHDYIADTCVATAESSTRATRAGARAAA